MNQGPIPKIFRVKGSCTYFVKTCNDCVPLFHLYPYLWFQYFAWFWWWYGHGRIFQSWYETLQLSPYQISWFFSSDCRHSWPSPLWVRTGHQVSNPCGHLSGSPSRNHRPQTVVDRGFRSETLRLGIYGLITAVIINGGSVGMVSWQRSGHQPARVDHETPRDN